MTTPPGEAPVPRKRLKVEPEEGGRLEQLLVEGKRAKDVADEHGERAEQYKADIKEFLLSLFPEGDAPDAFDIAADPHGRYPAYSLTRKTGWRLDTDAMKRDDPELYVRFAKKTKPAWELRESRGGRGRVG